MDVLVRESSLAPTRRGNPFRCHDWAGRRLGTWEGFPSNPGARWESRTSGPSSSKLATHKGWRYGGSASATHEGWRYRRNANVGWCENPSSHPRGEEIQSHVTIGRAGDLEHGKDSHPIQVRDGNHAPAGPPPTRGGATVQARAKAVVGRAQPTRATRIKWWQSPAYAGGYFGQTCRPPRYVALTVVPDISSGCMVRTSLSRMTKSAAQPGAILPSDFSSPAA